jgi:hypothetical protein
MRNDRAELLHTQTRPRQAEHMLGDMDGIRLAGQGSALSDRTASRAEFTLVRVLAGEAVAAVGLEPGRWPPPTKPGGKV